MELIQALRATSKVRRIVTRTSILAMGAALLPLLPQAARATTYTINPVSVHGAAPATGLTYTTATANCQNDAEGPTGTDVVVGGGALETISADGVMAGNAQRLEGSGPSKNGTSFSANGDTNDQFWIGVDGVGGMVDSNGGIETWSLCDDLNALTGSSGTIVEEASAPYPNTSLSANPVGVTCPSSNPATKLLSGGAYVTPPDGSLKPIASYPFLSTNGQTTPSLYPAASGSTTADSWASIGWEGGMGTSGNTEYVYAICSKRTAFTNTVNQNWNSTAISTGSTSRTSTVQCTSGNPVGGGWSVDSVDSTYNGSTAFSQSPSSGDHENGSYPIVATGLPDWADTQPTGWGVLGHSGGSESGSAYVHSFAMCVS